MILPLNDILNKKKMVIRKKAPNNVIYLGKKKEIREDEVVTLTAIICKNIRSGDKEIWRPSHKDLIADDYEEYTD